MHAVGRPGEPALSPLHHAVANGNEAMVALLLAANASPFLVVGEATPLDAASAAGLTSIVRRCEACGLFASWLYKCEQPHGLRGMLTGRATWELRWTAVVPRFRQTSGGLLCKHQARGRVVAEGARPWFDRGGACPAPRPAALRLLPLLSRARVSRLLSCARTAR